MKKDGLGGDTSSLRQTLASILIPLDFTAASSRALQAGLELKKKSGCALRVLLVSTAGEDAERKRQPGGDSAPIEQLARNFVHHVCGEGESGQVETLIGEDIIAAVARTANSAGADTILFHHGFRELMLSYRASNVLRFFTLVALSEEAEASA